MSPHDPELLVEDLGGRHPLPEALRPLTCPHLDRVLLWAIGASLDLAHGGIALHLAPAGRYTSHETIVVPWMVLEEWDTIEPTPLVGRTFWRNLHPRPPELPLELLPPRQAGPRPLLLALAPADQPWGGRGGRALEGASGDRMAKALGTTLPALLATCETANLLEHPDEHPEDALRRLDREGTLNRRLVVVVGRSAAMLLGEGHEVADLRRWGGTLVGVVPHPSSVSSAWNDPAIASVARGLVVDALVAARAVPTDGLDDAVAAARLGRWPGWVELANRGVAAHSPTPGHAWLPRLVDVEGRRGVAWSRRWATGAADIVPMWGDVYTLTLEAQGERVADPFSIAKIDDHLEAMAIAEEWASCHRLREVAAADRSAAC